MHTAKPTPGEPPRTLAQSGTTRAVLLVLAGLLVFAVGPAHGFKRTATGEPLKDFTLETGAGKDFRLSEHLGKKATLLVFWAQWSPRSAEALKDFQELYAAHGPEDLQVVAVNVEHQDWEAGQIEEVRAFVGERGLIFPVLFDRQLSVFDHYGVIAVPSSVLADDNGQIVEMLEGYANVTRQDFLDRILEKLGVLPKATEEAKEDGRYRPKGKAARHYQAGLLLREKGMGQRAMEAFRRALKEDPAYADAHKRLAEVLESEGLAQEAKAERARAQELGSIEPSSSAKTDGDAAGMRPNGKKPRDAAARYVRMGRLLMEKNATEEALKAFAKAVEKDPGWGEAYLHLADALAALGRTQEAEQARARAATSGATAAGLGSYSEDGSKPAPGDPTGVSPGTR